MRESTCTFTHVSAGIPTGPTFGGSDPPLVDLPCYHRLSVAEEHLDLATFHFHHSTAPAFDSAVAGSHSFGPDSTVLPVGVVGTAAAAGTVVAVGVGIAAAAAAAADQPTVRQFGQPTGLVNCVHCPIVPVNFGRPTALALAALPIALVFVVSDSTGREC